jgi:hypothetical protein
MNMLPVLALAAASLLPLPASAGVYADTLGKCLVSATSDEDKASLVRWMFAGVTLHPAASSLSAVTTEQREQINRVAAQLIERLLTATCRKETSEALRFEGPIAMQLSFQILGQVSSTAMMTHPAVGAGFAELNKYLDEKKILDLANIK